MLQQTSVDITYFVDFPPAEGILRHLTFASKAADRKLYSAGTNIILSQVSDQMADEDNVFSRRTLVNSGTSRSVRPRLACEDMIHQPLLMGNAAEDEYDLEVASINRAEDPNNQTEDDLPVGNDDRHQILSDQGFNQQAETEDMSLARRSDDEGHDVLRVEAIDPGITIATEVNPQVRWTGSNREDQQYIQQLERRLIALENRSSSYLTGELSADQLHSLDDSLQLKLARMMHPMIDMLTRDIQEYMDKEDATIDKRLLTTERASLSRMEEQEKAAVLRHGQDLDESMTKVQRQNLDGLTEDMHAAFIKAEQ